MSLDKFQSVVLATRAQYERSEAILGLMGVGWTPSFLFTCYLRASRNLIASFVRVIRKLWPQKLREGTRESLHSSIRGPKDGWTPHPN